jgi:hypothetical protein
MSEHANINLANAKNAVLEVLNGRGKKAFFATELLAGLRRYNLGKDAMDQALGELEADSVLVLRDHFCADPHLAEVDLRVVALVQPALGDQAHAAVLREIDLAWNKWLGEYLANHRCG